MRQAFYLLFVFSGFAGLVYESIWSHYLKLFLGHAAYAQSLVLCIFMGGMALGAWIAGDLTRRWRQPLLGYALIEALLGVAALTFDPIFRGMQAWFFEALLPRMGDPVLIDIVKWTLSAALILPQSILLGATFPLMSAGIVRLYPTIAGRTLAWLYFTNSLGAAAGVLLSGFYLVDKVGLPGTILTAGLVNFALALLVFLLVRSTSASSAASSAAEAARATQVADPALLRLILLAAFMTGAASFLYEIGWIRMLSLVLGSATHSFELMLSAFIFGLAAGSYWMRHRIDRLENPLRFLGRIQVLMALFALLSLPLYLKTFEWMAAFWHTVQSSTGGYGLFNAFSYSLCFLLMLPATFCAGMTLPLMTSILLRDGYHEGSIGRVYAANTLGAISGILLAVHVVMPLLGLRQVVVAGALIDAALGVWLLLRAGREAHWTWLERGVLALFVVLSLGIVSSVHLDPNVTASGVYRIGKSRLDAQVLFHRDGKTSTVDVARYEDGTISISTNGKVDAGLNFEGAVGADDYTMIMLSVLSLASLSDAQTAAVIGMGSGTSSHALLHDAQLRQVDTIEIEPAMVEGARFFGAATEKVFKDPRSHIRIEDAKTYFARSGRRYDLILSEPSNPWVSGIASLFSGEFYSQVQRYLTPQGIFVQWLHLYEIDLPLVSTVMNALSAHFDDYVIYASNNDDMMILAKPKGRLPELSAEIFADAGFESPLQRLNLRDLPDLQIRRLGSKSTLQPYFASMSMPANSDYFPVLDQNASRARFQLSDAREFLQVHSYSLRLEERSSVLSQPLSGPRFYMPVPGAALRARALAALVLGEPFSDASIPAPLLTTAALLGAQGADCAVWGSALRDFVIEAAPLLPAATGASVLRKLRANACARYAQSPLWMGLLEGITQAQPQRVIEVSLPLLQTLLHEQRPAQFVVAELLLAYLQTGQVSAAAELLAHIRGLPDTVPIAYLRANIAQRRMHDASGAAPAAALH